MVAVPFFLVSAAPFVCPASEEYYFSSIYHSMDRMDIRIMELINQHWAYYSFKEIITEFLVKFLVLSLI
jgi:hypothetical protein